MSLLVLLSPSSTFPSLFFSTIHRTHLVAGTAQSLLSAHVTLVVLSPSDDDSSEQEEHLFQKLSLSRSIAQKVLEGVGNEKPVLARVSREAKEILRERYIAGGDSNLEGLF
jgi:hypothetical protein